MEARRAQLWQNRSSVMTVIASQTCFLLLSRTVETWIEESLLCFHCDLCYAGSGWTQKGVRSGAERAQRLEKRQAQNLVPAKRHFDPRWAIPCGSDLKRAAPELRRYLLGTKQIYTASRRNCGSSRKPSG